MMDAPPVRNMYDSQADAIQLQIVSISLDTGNITFAFKIMP